MSGQTVPVAAVKCPDEVVRGWRVAVTAAVRGVAPGITGMDLVLAATTVAVRVRGVALGITGRDLVVAATTVAARVRGVAL